MKYFLATVHILVKAESADSGADGVSVILSELGRGFVHDWGYENHLKEVPVSDTYEEGGLYALV